jgi:voltage-gated potassium channel Kch
MPDTIRPTADRTEVAAPPRGPSLRQRLRYLFDASLAKGPIALIRWLAVLSLVLIVIAALIIWLFGGTVRPAGAADGLGFIEAGWQTLMRTLDAGTMGGDEGWPFRLVMLLVTLGGIFLVSALIGVLTTGMEERMAELRKGRSIVLERDHTLVVGWSEKIFTLLSELAVANENVRRPRVVVLADRDKVEMEDEIRARLGDSLGRTKVICRSGDPLVVEDLAIANPAQAKSVVILGPDLGRSDPFVLKSLLALTKSTRPESQHIVSTVTEHKTMSAALTVARTNVQLINVGDLISRVMAQTCRQSGLSLVYRELLDFDGDEIYFSAIPALAGTAYGDALLRFEASSLIGIRRASGEVLVNPPMDLVFQAGDEAIAISTDDDTVVLAPQATAPDDSAIVVVPSAPTNPERTLVLGWNDRGVQIVRHLDDYVAAGSHTDIVSATSQRLGAETLSADLEHMTVNWIQGDPSDRAVLESLELHSYDHALLLADADELDHEAADTQTLISLLHLRDLARIHDHPYSVVTEILDGRNRLLAQGDHADDFIVSDELVSLMLAQVSEHAALNQVLTGLFDSDGSEIYLKPAGEYVRVGATATYATVVESARRRGQTAIGFRDAGLGMSEQHNYGLAINPHKSASRTWAAADRVIVLSAD